MSDACSAFIGKSDAIRLQALPHRLPGTPRGRWRLLRPGQDHPRAPKERTFPIARFGRHRHLFERSGCYFVRQIMGNGVVRHGGRIGCLLGRTRRGQASTWDVQHQRYPFTFAGAAAMARARSARYRSMSIDRRASTSRCPKSEAQAELGDCQRQSTDDQIRRSLCPIVATRRPVRPEGTRDEAGESDDSDGSERAFNGGIPNQTGGTRAELLSFAAELFGLPGQLSACITEHVADGALNLPCDFLDCAFC